MPARMERNNGTKRGPNSCHAAAPDDDTDVLIGDVEQADHRAKTGALHLKARGGEPTPPAICPA